MENEARQILEHLKAASRVVVISHKDADGDTLGSALAMSEVIRGLGKDVVTRVPPPVPGVYSFLPGFGEINPDEGGRAPDLVVVMDASNLHRLSDTLGVLPAGTPVVNIDHHLSNDRFGDLNLVVPDASSTAEVTFDLLAKLEIPVSATMATNLYAGLLTDTGGFRHENTTYRALEIAAALVKAGADAADIAERIYKSKQLTTMKLTALTMATFGYDCDDRLVHAFVSQDMLRRAGARMDESEGLIDMLQSVEGLLFAVLFKENAPELTKISVRSRGAANANELAAVFGGGGHARAAGAEIRLPLEAAREAVLAAARRMLEQIAAS
ncbi:MAG: bifunctional oligoribonuclease/PAP phosphatase NrnA [Candidatus Dormibacteria bacterium]